MAKDKSDMIRHSILELALIPEDTTPSEVFKNIKELAQKAEEWGYSRFWLAEHHNSLAIASSATAVLIGDVAGATRSIRVGSGGIMLPNHSPLIIAEQFATLALLYPGRIDLGLGRAPGTDQLTAAAIRPDRMKSILNFPGEIRQVEQYLAVSNSSAKVRVPFAEGVKVPMYVLGSSTDSAHVAAEMGLPYAFASHFAPMHLLEAFKIYRNNFKPSEYLDQPYTIAAINVIISETYELAERELTSLIRMFYGVLTGVPSLIQPPTEMTAELRQIWEHPQVQQMLKYTFFGNDKTVKKQVSEFIETTAANEIIAVSNQFAHASRLRTFEFFANIMSEINR